MSAPQEIPRVFISYTHDSAMHDVRVLQLANDLRGDGFEVDLDQFHANQDWPLWMEKNVADSRYVLVVCTETYLRRWNNDEKPGKGLGAQWESRLTRQHLYEAPTQHDKFVPVVFDRADLAYIPTPLRNVTHVVLAGGIGGLLNRLRNIAPGQKAPLRTSLAPVALAPDFFSHEPGSGGGPSHYFTGVRGILDNVVHHARGAAVARRRFQGRQIVRTRPTAPRVGAWDLFALS